MAQFNTFDVLSEMTRVYLTEKTGIQNVLSNQIAGEITANKKGDSVKVYVDPNLGYAEEYDDVTDTIIPTVSNESTVDVTVTNHFHKALKVTTKESAMEVENVFQRVVEPLLDTIDRTVNQSIIATMYGGFYGNKVGTLGNIPSTFAHLKAGVKKLKDNGVPDGIDLVSVISTDVWSNFLGAPEFGTYDYNSNRDNGLAGRLTPALGIQSFWDNPFSQAWVAPTTGTSIAVKGASQTGLFLIVDGITSTEVQAGATFVIAGNATIYTVVTRSAVSAGEATLVLDKPLAVSPANDAVLTFQTASQKNIIFHPGSVALAMVAPQAPLEGRVSRIIDGGGYSIRLSQIEKGLSNLIVVDMLYGGKVINGNAGVIFNG